MTEPKRYYRNEMSEAVLGPVDFQAAGHYTPIVVLDPSDDADMQRLMALWPKENGGHPIADSTAKRLIATLTRYAAGETPTPPVETFGPGDVVRDKAVPRRVYMVAANGYYDHALQRVRESHGLSFTSEHYERVGGDEA